MLPILLAYCIAKWVGIVYVSVFTMGNIFTPPNLVASLAPAMFTPPATVASLFPLASVAVLPTVVLPTVLVPVALLDSICPRFPQPDSVSVTGNSTLPICIARPSTGMPLGKSSKGLSVFLPSLSSLVWLLIGVAIGRGLRKTTPVVAVATAPANAVVGVTARVSVKEETEHESSAVTVASPGVFASPIGPEVANCRTAATGDICADVVPGFATVVESPTASVAVVQVKSEAYAKQQVGACLEMTASGEIVCSPTAGSSTFVDAGCGSGPSTFVDSRVTVGESSVKSVVATPITRRKVAPAAPTAPRTGDIMASKEGLAKLPRGKMPQTNLLQRLQSMRLEETPTREGTAGPTTEVRKSALRTPVLCVNNPLLSEEDCGSAVRMLMPGDSPVDYNSPLSLRAKPRTRIPVFTGGSWPSTSSPLAPMKRLGSSLRPSSLRSVARAEQARPEAVEDALEDAGPLGVGAKEKPVQSVWPAQKLAQVESMHAASVRKRVVHATSWTAGTYVRPCETLFSPGSPSARQAAKNTEEPPSPTPGSGRRGMGIPSSTYKPPPKRLLEVLRKP